MDEALEQVLQAADRPPTMGKLAKVRYTHADMIDFLLANPSISQNELAARYGFSASWVSNMMASDAWQSQLAARRKELVDPALAITLEERFRGLALRSLEVVMAKLEKPNVSDNVALKALELGAKATGVGGNAPPTAPAPDHLESLASRLLNLQSRIRQGVTIENVEVVKE